MAFIQFNSMSQCLLRPVNFNVILPVDKIFGESPEHYEKKSFKTLYLLHGVYGAQHDWTLGTNLVRWAEDRNLAVVMPAGENGFYVDNAKAHNYYGEFIGRELVELTRAALPLSDKKEDTFIAGLSMGGYGAIRNGLKYRDTFGYIAGLSSALVTDGIDQRDNQPEPYEYIATRDYAETCFGDLSKVEGSDLDTFALAKTLADEYKAAGKTKDLPKIFMACGLSDGLLPLNQKMRDIFNENGYDLTYYETPGDHNWDFWNEYIQKVIEWLPLKVQAGLNSGNIH